MKRKLLLATGLASIAMLVSCGGDTTSKTPTSEGPTSVPTTVEPTTSDQTTVPTTSVDQTTSETTSETSIAAKSNLTIHYAYADGTKAKEDAVEEVTDGVDYSFDVPEINFMAPSVSSVTGKGTAKDAEVTVTYDYSGKEVKTTTPGQQFEPFMVDADKGLSFNYVIAGNTGDWVQVLVGTNWFIYNSVLRSTEEEGTKFSDWYENVAESTNGGLWSSLLSGQGQDILATVTLNTDGSIIFYKNGLRILKYAPSLANSNSGADVFTSVLEEFNTKVLDDVRANGFSLGVSGPEWKVSYTLKNLVVGAAMDDAAVAEHAAKYASNVVAFQEADATPISANRNSIELIGSEYVVAVPTIEGYKFDVSEIKGVSGESKETKIVVGAYNVGTEHLLEDSVKTIDHSTGGGWTPDIIAWFQAANQLTGDFVLRTKYLHQGCQNRGDDQAAGNNVWKTLLLIIEDDASKDRAVFRYDWWGWMDDINGDKTQIATTQNKGNTWVNNFDADMIPILENCNMVDIISRTGDTITRTCTLLPQAEAYKGQIYTYSQSLVGVTAEKINIAYSAEFAKATFSSVMY